ncbi:MAG: hypothetical protein MZU95_07765 [Desulfomicrobium escambiense]|nr:hypothetical protein [Desulfomicrobium escambiense]
MADNAEILAGRQMEAEAGPESTDLLLMADALAQEERSPWKAERIQKALIVEAGVEPQLAGEIAAEVEEDSIRVQQGTGHDDPYPGDGQRQALPEGLDAKLKDHSRIGIPLYDLESMMLSL